MEENNKRREGGFFGRSDEDPQNRRDNETEDRNGGIEESQDRPSYYYSYGPYKSQQLDPYKNEQQAVSAEEPTEIEMTTPRPVKPYQQVTQEPRQSAQASGWQVSQQPKRSRFKSGFAAFLAGAVVVGGLMFASDKANLFTPSQGVMSSGSSSQSSGSGNASAQSAAWDLKRPDNIAELAQTSGPAVVKVETYVTKQASSRSNPLLNDPFFRQFFGDGSGSSGNGSGGNGGSQAQKQQAGLGTGFIFEKSGYILTNEHVVDGADEIQVTVQGYDQPFKAKLLGSSYDLDLAVLKIENSKDLPYLPMGSSKDIGVGNWVVAIGNPYGFDHTVTVGVLSAKDREISIDDTKGTRNYKSLLQTDASINPGNSGGPLLNLNGEVIGINTAVSSEAQGIGFAISSETVQNVIDNLKNGVEIPKEPTPFMGVSLADINENYLKDLGIDTAEGAIVADVQMGSPAFKAGVKQNDVIQTLNGEKIKNSSAIVSKIQAMKVGDKVKLGIVRDGKKMDIEVTIGNKNSTSPQSQSQKKTP